MKNYSLFVRFGFARVILAAVPIILIAACSDSGTEPEPEPTTGSLEVSVATTGEEPDSDGYTVIVDGEEMQDVGANASATLSSLEPGSYEVQLGGVAENCSVQGESPRTVEVTAGETASVSFEVSCEPTTGDLRIDTETTGSDLDSDGYTVTVDPGGENEASKSIGTNSAVTFSDVAAGQHTVEISGVANNCMVSEPSQTVDVPAGGQADVTFEISCTATTGDLEISATTTGEDPDPDGYTVVVDGNQSQSLGANGNVIFPDVAAEDHQVELQGVAPNCTVSSNPRTVTVPGGGSVSTTFEVTCTTAIGDLEVTASTSGEDPDPDGYTVTVDPGTPDALSKSLDPNGTTTFSNLDQGDHEVEISGVAENCTVTDNPRTVTVPNGGTASTTFEVSCTQKTGDLEVSVSTSGEDLDPDGYDVVVDPGTPDETSKSVGLDETVTFTGLAATDHEIELQGLAANCSATENPKTVTVPFNGTATASFDVSCTQRVGDIEVSTSTTGEDFDDDGYTVKVDPGTAGEESEIIGLNGTVTFSDVDEGDHEVELTGVAPNCSVAPENPRTLSVTHGSTTSTTFEVNCVDERIVFEARPDGGDWDIYRMNADGSGQTNLTNDPAKDRLPAWSPDKTEIVFNSDRDGQNDIWVMNSDGTSPENLTSDLSGNLFVAEFSPDGTKIAFTRVVSGVGDIWVMNADGSNQTNITNSTSDDRHPRWSPDGTKIAFRSSPNGDTEIFVMDAADGSNRTNLSNSANTDEGLPDFSPDGSLIAFSRHFFGSSGDIVDTEIIVMDAATGGNQTNLTNTPGADDEASSWSPDGGKIAFTSNRDGQREIYIMNADGTNQTRITVTDTRAERAPAWEAP